MKTRIYNARILTMEADRPVFDGEIHIDGDTITYAGPEKDRGETIWDEQIDARRNLIMPGFKNALPLTASGIISAVCSFWLASHWCVLLGTLTGLVLAALLPQHSENQAG